MKKIVSKVLIAALLTASVTVNTNVSQAATTLKVSTNEVSLTVGKTKVVSANKEVTWSSSNKKIAKVKKVNSKKAKISAVKSGSCKIVAKYKKQKKTIKVTVKKQTSHKVSVSPTPIVMETPNVTASTPTPNNTPMPEVTATPAADIYTETAAQVTVKTVSSSATSARLEIRNDNSTEVIYGKAYQIQKLVNGSWENMKPIAENIMFPAVGISIFGNTTGYIDVDWTDYYGRLENGQYRIVKEYIVNGACYKISNIFEVYSVVDKAKLEVNNVSQDTKVITYTITNNLNENLNIGILSLEKYDGEKWLPVERKDYWVQADYLYILPNQQSVQTLALTRDFVDVSSGSYRLGIETSCGKIYAQFTID